jgi:hypothetical protein
MTADLATRLARRSPSPAWSGTARAAASLRLERVKRRRGSHPRVLRRRTRVHRPRHRLPRQPEPGSNRPKRKLLTAMAIPDLSPVLHCDHPSDRGGRPTFQRALVAWFQRALTHDSRTKLAQGRLPEVALDGRVLLAAIEQADRRQVVTAQGDHDALAELPTLGAVVPSSVGLVSEQPRPLLQQQITAKAPT